MAKKQKQRAPSLAFNPQTTSRLRTALLEGKVPPEIRKMLARVTAAHHQLHAVEELITSAFGAEPAALDLARGALQRAAAALEDALDRWPGASKTTP